MARLEGKVLDANSLSSALKAVNEELAVLKITHGTVCESSLSLRLLLFCINT
jgi:hypothetical protein